MDISGDTLWAKYFAEYIFPKMDETPSAVFYSRKNSRPNIQIWALILKELLGLSDDQLLTALMFDIRFQYALHTTSYMEQPLKDASILQNPADPDATYCEKAGKQNRGYALNVTEATGENGSIVLDYQYEQNTHSDSQFLHIKNGEIRNYKLGNSSRIHTGEVEKKEYQNYRDFLCGKNGCMVYGLTGRGYYE